MTIESGEAEKGLFWWSLWWLCDEDYDVYACWWVLLNFVRPENWAKRTKEIYGRD